MDLARPRARRERSAAALQLEQYAENDFTDYYSENPAAVFAGTVWTNNAWIAAQCVLFGITGFWPIMVLVQNAVGVGTAAAVHGGLRPRPTSSCSSSSRTACSS